MPKLCDASHASLLTWDMPYQTDRFDYAGRIANWQIRARVRAQGPPGLDWFVEPNGHDHERWSHDFLRGQRARRRVASHATPDNQSDSLILFFPDPHETIRWIAGACSDRPATNFIFATEARIVGSFLGDDDVVRMALVDRGGGYLDKPGLGPEFVDGSGSAVAHAGPQAADELEDEFGEGALVRNTALDALGNELLSWRGFAVSAVLVPGSWR